MRLEIEKQAIKKEKDEISKHRVVEIDDTLKELKVKEAKLKEAWNEEKNISKNINSKKKELEEAKKRLNKNKPKYRRLSLEDDDEL